MIQEEFYLDLNGEPIARVSPDKEPINLDLVTGHPPLSNFNRTQVTRTKGETKKKTQANSMLNTKKSRLQKNLNKTVYRLPSLSQCIENQILPRNSEYMRRLYSIALKNHENHVPSFAGTTKRAIRITAPSSLPAEPEAQTQNRPDIAHSNERETPATGISVMHDHSQVRQAIAAQPQSNTGLAYTYKIGRLKNARSQSFATLKVKNLQFPFDHQTQGGFSQVKQREQNLYKNPNPEATVTATGKKRPFTAGRLHIVNFQGIDLFNNQMINQLSTGALIEKKQSQKELDTSWKRETFKKTGQQNQGMRESAELANNDDNRSSSQITNPQIKYADQKGQFMMVVKPHKQIDENGGNITFNVKENKKQQTIKSEIAGKTSINNQIAKKDIENKSRISSRHHSDSGSPNRHDDETLSAPFFKTNFDNQTLSHRVFKPMHFKEQNGTELVLQMSGSGGLTTKRLKNIKQTSNDSKSQGSKSSGKGKHKKKGNLATRLSSTHSLQVNMQAAHQVGKEFDKISQTHTNRLEDSEIQLSDQGVKIMEHTNSAEFDQIRSGSRNSQRRHRNSQSYMSSQDLKNLENEVKPIKLRNTVRPFTAKRQSQPTVDESRISMMSISQNQLDNQLRLKQVYEDEKKPPKIIHRIPLPYGSNTHSFPSNRDDSSRHQVLLVTNDPKQLRKLIINDASISNMSNPLNNFQQLSADRMKPIKIKSIFFDSNGNQQIREVDMISPLSAEKFNSPQKEKILQSEKHNAAENLSSAFDTKELDYVNNENHPGQEEMCLHKQFRVTMQIKRLQNRTNTDATSLAHSQPIKAGQATLKGKQMRLSSAQLRRKKPTHPNIQNRRQQQDVFVDLKQRNIDLNESIANGLMENSKATMHNVVHNVPLLALPTSDTATEFLHVSRVPSLNGLSHSQTSLTKLIQLQQYESQKIINSLNASNVRANKKGDKAKHLENRIDLIEVNNYEEEAVQTVESSQSNQPVRQKQKNMQQLGNIIHSDSSRSRHMVGSFVDERKLTNKNGFTAALSDEKAPESKSDDDNTMSPAMKPKMIDNFNERLIESAYRGSPSIVNIQEKESEDEGGDIIQEQEEGSSERSKSKISISITSLRKGQVSPLLLGLRPIEILDRNETFQQNEGLRNADSRHSGLRTESVPIHQAIRSVYEAEAQALKCGIIKAYSGRKQICRTRKDNSKNNIDLQHFLSSDNAFDSSQHTKKSEPFTLQNNNSKLSQQLAKGSAISNRKDLAPEKESSQVSSSLRYSFTQIVHKKPIGDRPRMSTPSDQPKTMVILEQNQQSQTEVLKKAQQIMLEAKLLRLDSQVINQQLLDLFSNDKEPKKSIFLMEKASLNWGTQTLQTGSQHKGFDIPFKITHKHRQVRRSEIARDPIQYNQQSASSILKVGHHHAIGFAPGSPVSNVSTVRNIAQIDSKRGYPQGINSQDGSSNRFSRVDPPQFGGVASSRFRIGDVLNSQKTEILKAAFEQINESFEQNRQYASTGKQITTAQIIDYNSQAIMNRPSLRTGLIDSARKKIDSPKKKVSMLPPNKAAHQERLKKRPHTANRYGVPINMISQSASQQSDEVYQHRIPGVIFDHKNEHLEQPAWATRKNLKSKFNLMTTEQQAKQVQKFFIECVNPTKDQISPMRGLAETQLISPVRIKSLQQTRNELKPSDLRNTLNRTDIIRSDPQPANISSIEQDTKEIQDTPILTKKRFSMPLNKANARTQILLDSRNNDEYNGKGDIIVIEDSESEVPADDNDDDLSISGYQKSSVFTGEVDSDQKQNQAINPPKLLHNQSMGCQMIDAAIFTGGLKSHRHLVTHFQDGPRLNSEQRQSEHSKANAFYLHSSQKSLVNSAKILEKVSSGRYVRRSLAGDQHFSVSNSLINSQKNLKKSNR